MELLNPLLMTAAQYRDEFRDAWKDASRKLSENRVHDLRVAARRLGSVLLLVEAALERNHSCRARRRIRRLMKRLGALRDLQVQILLVRKWKSSESVKQFLKTLGSAEAREKKRVRDYMQAHGRKWVLQDVKGVERDAAKKIRKIPPATRRARIVAAIAAQREELEKAKTEAGNRNPKSLHALRTTARKLRYCLEAAGSTVGAASQSELGNLRRRQTRLGHERDLQLLEEKYSKWKIGARPV